MNSVPRSAVQCQAVPSSDLFDADEWDQEVYQAIRIMRANRRIERSRERADVRRSELAGKGGAE